MDHHETPYETVLKYAFLITPYASVIAIQYLWGYWGSFNINIFNYLSLADIFKLALLPLVYIVAVALTAATIIYFTTLFVEKGKKQTPVSPRFTLILNGVMALLGVVLLIVMTNPDKWLWSGTIMGILLAKILGELEVSKRYIANKNLRFCIALLITMPMFAAYGVGKRNAQRILRTEDKSRLVDTKLFREYGSETFAKKHLLEQEQLKFIGFAGDYLFFISVDNSRVFVVKFSDLHFLEFNPWG